MIMMSKQLPSATSKNHSQVESVNFPDNFEVVFVAATNVLASLGPPRLIRSP